MVARSGELAVTDRGETFQYLDRSGDDVYTRIDVEGALAICRPYGVHVDDRDGETYPEIISMVGDRPLRAAIGAVCVAVDELFSIAMGRTAGRCE